MSAVKVTFVSSHSRAGGSERYLEQLIHRLGGEWIDRVVCLEDGPLVERLRGEGVPTDVIATGARAKSIGRAALRLRRSFRNRPPMVVHANGVKAALVATLAGAPRTIWVKHDFSWDGPLARFIARRSSLVVGVSRAVLEAIGTSARTAVAYNGIDATTVDRDRARELLRDLGGAGSSYVVLVGRLHPVKGHVDMLAAAPDILRSHPDVRFIFVGGPDPSVPDFQRVLEDKARESGVDHAIAFVGHRNDALLLMAGADVGVIPSVRVDKKQGREGFPLVGLELLSVGTPIVAYASGGIPELVGDCGVLVEPDDRNMLASAISELLADPDRRGDLARCGHRRVGERFTFAETVRSMATHYREVSAS